MRVAQKIALMSIKPNFANQILFGVKRFEYRKRPISSDTTHIILYMTAPIMKIVGVAEVKHIHQGAPTTIWEKTKQASGITRKFYREYFTGKKKAFAIEIDNVHPLNTWINPKTINKNFTSPQSFYYVDKAFYNAIFNEGVKKKNANCMFFLGGIHGVGKSTLCKKLQGEIDVHVYTASKLMAEKNFQHVNNQKQVKDVNANQRLLLAALKDIPSNKPFILDGHFCLLNKNNNIERIPETIFQKMAPMELFLVELEAKQIQKNLFSRDSITYDLALIEEMLVAEREYAEILSKQLHIPLHIINASNYNKLKDHLTFSLASCPGK